MENRVEKIATIKGMNKSRKFKLESLSDGSNDAVLGTFTGIFSKLDAMSQNKRFYSSDFWHKVLQSEEVIESLRSGKMLGIFEHPTIMEDYTEDGIATCRHPQNAAFVVKKLWIEDDKVMGKAYILNTPLGKTLASFFKAKDEEGNPLIELSISARGYTINDYIDSDGVDQMNPDDYYLQTFDIVMNPGIVGARVKMEGKKSKIANQIEKLENMIQETYDFIMLKESYKNELREQYNLK